MWVTYVLLADSGANSELHTVNSLTAWHGMLDFPITQDSEHILHFVRMRKISTYSYHRVFAQQGPIRVSLACRSPESYPLNDFC